MFQKWSIELFIGWFVRMRSKVSKKIAVVFLMLQNFFYSRPIPNKHTPPWLIPKNSHKDFRLPSGHPDNIIK